MDRHGEELQADFQQYYGLQLSGIVTGEISPPRATALIRQLPHDSRFMAEIRGGSEYRGWDFDRYLRAAMVDAINNQTHAFILANTDKKKRKPKPPQPVPTPDRARAEADKRTSGQNAFQSQMNIMFNRLKANEQKVAKPPD